MKLTITIDLDNYQNVPPTAIADTVADIAGRIARKAIQSSSNTVEGTFDGVIAYSVVDDR